MGEKSRVTISDDCRGQQSNSSILKEKHVFFSGNFSFFFILTDAVMIKGFTRQETFQYAIYKFHQLLIYLNIFTINYKHNKNVTNAPDPFIPN